MPPARTLRDARGAILLGAWFSADARTLATCSIVDKEVAFWDLVTGARSVAAKRQGPVYWSEPNPVDISQFAVAAGDGLGVYSIPQQEKGAQVAAPTTLRPRRRRARALRDHRRAHGKPCRAAVMPSWSSHFSELRPT